MRRSSYRPSDEKIIQFIIQNGRCKYCRCKMNLRGMWLDGVRSRRPILRERFATWDHVIPISKGGLDKPHNRVLACHRCNNLKGDSLVFTPKRQAA